MLTELDQNTLANMTAALENVCKKIPAENDSNDLRKRIADEMIACARGRIQTSFIDFQRAGLSVLEETNSPSKPSLLGRLFRFSRSPI
jgi:hypothetical protein